VIARIKQVPVTKVIQAVYENSLDVFKIADPLRKTRFLRTGNIFETWGQTVTTQRFLNKIIDHRIMIFGEFPSSHATVSV
jgi:hypothetical protein